MHFQYPIAGVGAFNGTPSSVFQERFTLPTIQRGAWYSPTNVNNQLMLFPTARAVTFGPPTKEIHCDVDIVPVTTTRNDHHDRFWVFPSSYTLRDPEIGVVFSFTVWNTFLSPNQNAIVDIQYNDIEGIVPTGGVGYSIHAFGIGELGFTVTDEAPASMSGSLEFIFDAGAFEIGLIVERDTTVPLPPSFPWVETLSWETNIITAEDGGEQRIALATSPEIKHEVGFLALETAETQRMVRQLLSTARNAPTIPLYQYATPLLVDTTIGAITLEASPQRGDLRVGDSIVVRDRKGFGETLRITGISGTTLSLANGMQNAFKRGSLVIPARDLIVPAEQTVNMWRVEAADYRFSGRPGVRRNPFLLEEYRWPFQQIGGRPILERRPLGNEQQNVVFDSGRRFQDQGRVISSKDPWRYSKNSTPVSFLLDTFFTPSDWDHWRTFMDHCRGAQRTFLMPSFRNDFELAAPVLPLSSQITVKGNAYSTVYADAGMYPAIRIETEAGVFYSAITSSTVVDSTKEIIAMDSQLPEDPEWGNVKQISLLSVNRLLTDEIKIEHYPQYSILSTTFRTVRE